MPATVNTIEKLKREIGSVAKEFDRQYSTIAAILSGMEQSLGGVAKLAREAGVPPSLKELRAHQSGPIWFGVRPPVIDEVNYNRVLAAVGATGYNFIIQIRPVSLDDLLTEEEQHVQAGGRYRLSDVHKSTSMRATFPYEMEIAINPARFGIPRSNESPHPVDQAAIIKRREKWWKSRLPRDLRPWVSMQVVDPSTIVQADFAYREKTGKPLLTNFYVSTGVPIPDFHDGTDIPEFKDGGVACVGRPRPGVLLRVSSWEEVFLDERLFAPAVVILPRRAA